MAENIPIFKGKASTYNELILESLWVDGFQTNWQLAKNVSRMSKNDKYRGTHNIYSVLIRKNGRLNDLFEKGYIFSDVNGRWFLTAKGIYALLILKPKILNCVDSDFYQFIQSIKEPFIQSIENDIKGPFGIQVKGLRTAVENNSLTDKILTLKGWMIQANIVKKLVEEGINLDRISKENLEYLLAINLKNVEIK